MRFISADTIYPISQNPINNGVIVLDQAGQILDVLYSDDGIEITNIEKHKGIITPGFVNAHCHLELSHLKGLIPEKTGIVNFAGHVIGKRNSISEEIKQEAIRLADEEMQRNGIVAVGDISNDDSTVEVKWKSKIHYHTFIELIGFNPANAQKIYDAGVELRKKYTSKNLIATLAPHAPYSVSLALMNLIANENDGKSTTIHNQESKAENEFFEKGTGDFLKLYESLSLNIDYFKANTKSALQSYLQNLVSTKNLALVHNTFSSEDDIRFAEKISSNLFWCLCPNANLYIEQSLPNAPLLMQNNCKIVIGTDSLASNHQLSITDELNKLIKQFPAISINQALSWATKSGAEFLGMQNEFGSIEKGKKPGLVLLEEEKRDVIVKGVL
jgi:cytosine/adenosine deaminase-related metal-dependent hydrolase